MTRIHTDNDTTGNPEGASHQTSPPAPALSPGPPASGADLQPDIDQLVAVTRLLSRDDRPESLEHLLFELGRHGLVLGYIGGEPVIVSIAGAPHRSLRSMGLTNRWIESLAEWDRIARHDADKEDPDYDGMEPGTDAIDRLWSSLDPLGRRLTESERSSVRKFVMLLPFGVVEEAMRTAANNIPDEQGPTARFKYFCGICWRKINETRARRTSAPGRGNA